MPDIDQQLAAMRAKSDVYRMLADPWLVSEVHRIMAEDAAAEGTAGYDFDIITASDHEDLNLATDYVTTVTATRHAAIAFRGRDVGSHSHGQRVRQMTLRVGRHADRGEYAKVYAGHADYFATVWCADIRTDARRFEAGAIVDLEVLRSMPPVERRRLERPGFSNVSFVGYDIASLIAHDAVRAAYPSEEYFTPYAMRPDPIIPGQESLL